jgi:hypothetical protein
VGAAADSPFVRARVAWSLGRLSNRQFSSIISMLAVDSSPLVRRCALEAILDRADDLTPATVLGAARMNIGHPDRRIRHLAAAILSNLPLDPYLGFLRDVGKGSLQELLTASLAAAYRGPMPHMGVVEEALDVFKATSDPDLRLQALRSIVLGLGDWNLTNASVEVYTGYEKPSSGRRRLGPFNRQNRDSSCARRSLRGTRSSTSRRRGFLRWSRRVNPNCDRRFSRK